MESNSPDKVNFHQKANKLHYESKDFVQQRMSSRILFKLIQVSVLWSICCLTNGSQELVSKTSSNKGDIDFIMMASQPASERTNLMKNQDILTNQKQEKGEEKPKNNTHPGFFLRILQFKTTWNSGNGKNNTRRLLELSLKPLFFVCCLCAVVLIYLLYRAVRIRKSLKSDKHVIQSTDSSKVLLNEA